MFPVSDDNSQRRTLPVITYGLIALNVLIFFIELNAGDEFIKDWAFIPARFSGEPGADAVTIITAMFMHGSWLHLFSNMLFLWIFGDNVEDRFGHLPFLIFYLLVGVAATFAQFAFTPNSSVPNVGASGAIAGVLGAYLIMFPQSRVNVLLGRQIVAMPAIIVLGLWIVLQLFSGVGTIAYTDETAGQGGIAYMAHIGGFFAGFIADFSFSRCARFPNDGLNRSRERKYCREGFDSDVAASARHLCAKRQASRESIPGAPWRQPSPATAHKPQWLDSSWQATPPGQQNRISVL